MKKVIQALAIGMLLLVLIPGMAWASPGKPPTAQDQLRELCGHPVWAKQVLNLEQGLRWDGEPVLEERSDPRKALHRPDEKFVSLGFKGSITLSFRRPIANNPGPDDLYVLVQETTWFDMSPDYPLERARVFLIADGKEYRAQGYVTSESNGTGLGIVTIPNKLDYVDGVKLVDATDAKPFGQYESWHSADGYDLDAVGTCAAPAE